jgi:hypothetical protein
VLGLRGKYTIPTEWGAVAPRFRVEYHHDFAGTSTIFLQYADLLSPVDLLPNLSSFIRRVCSGYALVWGVLRTQSV